MFQFYLSSIKSFSSLRLRRLNRGFNSTLVQLKGEIRKRIKHREIKFQFYLSSIKR